VIRLALIAVAGVLITFALNDSDGGQISPFVLPACLTLPLILALASVATGVGCWRCGPGRATWRLA
jgi:hypothetical protein